MYQVCTCPGSNLTAGDPHCPIHGQPPASVTYSYCESCATFRAKLDREKLAGRVQEELQDQITARIAIIDQVAQFDLYRLADAIIAYMKEG